MGQTILEFRLNRDKHNAVQEICNRLGITTVVVARKDYGQKLGALAGVNGFSKENKLYEGAELPAEMLIFSGMNSEQVDDFLAEYKKSGCEPIGLKAVITPSNVFWNVTELFQELMREHLSFGKK